MHDITRRQLIGVSGAVLMGALAGCSGDSDSTAEIESGIETAEGSLQEIETIFDDAGTAVNESDWSACLSQVESLREEASSARTTADEALSLAQEEEYSAAITVLEYMLEYLDIIDEMATEIEATCTEGQNGNTQAADEHWTTVQELNEDRLSKQSEVQEALEELR